MTEDIKAELQEWEGAWQDAPAEKKGEYENLPDGKYQVLVEEARFEKAKTSGRLQLAWVLRVLSPASQSGRKIFHYRGLDNEKSVGWMKREVHTCGVGVENITSLPDNLPKLLDKVVEVSLKTTKNSKGEFQNCYFNKLLDGGDLDGGDVAGVGSKTPDEDDIPF